MGRPSRRERVLSQARAIARDLSAIAPGEPVLATIANAPVDLAAMLGIWLAGGVAVPVPANAPAFAADAVQQATGARFRVDRGRHRKPLHGSPAGAGRLARRRPGHLHLGQHGQAEGRGHRPRPDGRQARRARPAARPLSRQDSIVVPLRLTFIFGIWVSLLAVRSGARLVLMPKFTPEAWRRPSPQGATVLAAVPTMLRSLLAGGAIAAPSPAHDPHRRRDVGRGARRQRAGGAAAGGHLRPLRPDRDGIVRLLPAACRARRRRRLHRPADRAGGLSSASARMVSPCPTAPRRARDQHAVRHARLSRRSRPDRRLVQRRLFPHRRPGAAAGRRPGRDRRPHQGHHLARRQQDRAGRDRRPALRPTRTWRRPCARASPMPGSAKRSTPSSCPRPMPS